MSGEKKHLATPRKMRRAREDGDTGKSPFLSGSAGLLSGIIILFCDPGPLSGLLDFAQREWGKTTDFSSEDMILSLARVGNIFLSAFASIALGVFAVVFLVELFQVGWHLSFKPLALKFERLNPVKGFSRILGIPEEGEGARWPRGAVLEGFKGVFFLIAAVALASAFTSRSALFLPATEVEQPVEVLAVIRESFIRVLFPFTVLYLLLGVVSLISARRARARRSMMSDEEFRRECREDEGTPEQKLIRREIHQELLAVADERILRRAKAVVVSSLTVK